MDSFFYSQLFQVLPDGDACRRFEQTGQVPRAGIDEGSQLFYLDLFLQVANDPILYDMNVFVDMPAVLQINTLLGITPIPADIDYQLACYLVNKGRAMPLFQ